MKKIVSIFGAALLVGSCSFAMAGERLMTASFLPGLSIPVGGAVFFKRECGRYA